MSFKNFTITCNECGSQNIWVDLDWDDSPILDCLDCENEEVQE